MASLPVALDQIVRRARGLYSLPAVAMKVLELTSSPTIDSLALKQCIENDPALTAKLLRVVNSSLFGLASQVGDLTQALALLGTKPLKLLVLGFSLPDHLLAGIQRDQLARYWRDTLTKAVASREISELLWQLPGDEAFIAGLLGEIGILVLVQHVGAPYVDFLDQVERSGDDLAAREKEWLGFDHTTLSARLLAYWGLPKPLVAAVAAPRSTGYLRRMPLSKGPLPKILHLAHLLTTLVARRRIGILPDLLEAGDAFCGLQRSDLTALVQCLEPKVAQLAEVLSLELPAGLDYSDVLVQAHAQLADAALEAVGDMVLGRPGPMPVGRAGRAAGPPACVVAREITDRSSTAAPIRPPAATVAGLAAATLQPPDSGFETRREKTADADPMKEGAAVLLGRLTAMVTCCRSQRKELSLLFVAVDNYDKVARTRSAEGSWRLAPWLEASIRDNQCPDAAVIQMIPSMSALLLPGCDRGLAVQIGRRLIDTAPGAPATRGKDSATVPTLSIGAATVAVPPRNFSARGLIDSAERCLYAARSCRNSCIKSIEVY